MSCLQVFHRKLNFTAKRVFSENSGTKVSLRSQPRPNLHITLEKETREKLLKEQFQLKRDRKEFFGFQFNGTLDHYGYVYMWKNKSQDKITIGARHKNLFREDFLTSLP